MRRARRRTIVVGAAAVLAVAGGGAALAAAQLGDPKAESQKIAPTRPTVGVTPARSRTRSKAMKGRVDAPSPPGS
jgi:hypothetical protein